MTMRRPGADRVGACRIRWEMHRYRLNWSLAVDHGGRSISMMELDL